jgi:hypothetical protein
MDKAEGVISPVVIVTILGEFGCSRRQVAIGHVTV